MAKVLVVLGMHRSGTSLLASWLHACGLSMGEETLGKGIGNDRGHFEDMDFLRLHENILRRAGTRSTGLGELAGIDPDAEEREAMARLVARKNAAHAQWGWKEPRTCLFVEEYARLLPTAKYLVVYRHHELVVDSLVRRDAKFRQARLARQPRWQQLLRSFLRRLGRQGGQEQVASRYLAAWIAYNEKLVALAERLGRDNVVVMESGALRHAAPALFAQLADWGFALASVDIAAIYDESMMQQRASQSPVVPAGLTAQADAVLAALDRLATPLATHAGP